MKTFGLKLDLLFLHSIAAFSTGQVLSNPDAQSHYAPQGLYYPRGNSQNEEYDEPSTTPATNNLKIEVDVPQLIRSYMGLADKQTRSEGNALDSKFQIEVKTPDISKMWESFKNILYDSFTDRQHKSPYVEEAPDSFKGTLRDSTADQQHEGAYVDEVPGNIKNILRNSAANQQHKGTHMKKAPSRFKSIPRDSAADRGHDDAYVKEAPGSLNNILRNIATDRQHKGTNVKKAPNRFKNILRDSAADRRHEGAYVEEARGTFKSQPITYPKNFHENNLLKLLKLKEKMMAKPSRRGLGNYDPKIMWFYV